MSAKYFCGLDTTRKWLLAVLMWVDHDSAETSVMPKYLHGLWVRTLDEPMWPAISVKYLLWRLFELEILSCVLHALMAMR